MENKHGFLVINGQTIGLQSSPARINDYEVSKGSVWSSDKVNDEYVFKLIVITDNEYAKGNFYWSNDKHELIIAPFVTSTNPTAIAFIIEKI